MARLLAAGRNSAGRCEQRTERAPTGAPLKGNRPANPADLLFSEQMPSGWLFSLDQLRKPLFKHGERFVPGIRSLEHNLQDLLALVAFAGFDSFDAALSRAVFDNRLRMWGNAVGPEAVENMKSLGTALERLVSQRQIESTHRDGNLAKIVEHPGTGCRQADFRAMAFRELG